MYVNVILLFNHFSNAQQLFKMEKLILWFNPKISNMQHQKNTGFSIVLFLLLYSPSIAQHNSNYNYSKSKEVTASKAAVVSAHPLASLAGLKIFRMGGNAFDAAIATQLALAVVYPGAGNIGGGGFMVAHLANGKNIALDYREKAPSAATRDMYLDDKGNPQMNLSQFGHLASGVPGTVAGIFETVKFAKLPISVLMEPAIDLAENGFAISSSEANSLNRNRDNFIAYNTTRPVLVKDQPWKAGDTLYQHDLAQTLRRIAALGIKGFYEGETAAMIVAEMNHGKGIITLDDLKNYKAQWRALPGFTYKGYQVLTMPLPSSGGIILEQMLKMIESRNVGEMKFQSPSSVQLMTEIERRAYADRAFFLGDPDFVKVPVKTLVSSSYLLERMHDFVPGQAGTSAATKEGEIHESTETTHFSVIDGFGNAVSVTTTLNGGYGSKTVVAGAGFLMNNEMDDFSVKPGVPNMYGAVGNEKNAIAPGKRMLSSMTPTILLKNGKPFLVIGTPGGTTIPTSVFQTIVNIIDFKMSVDDAVNKPKFHHQWLPDLINIETGFNVQTSADLKKMGYKIEEVSQIGRTEVIRIDRKGKKVQMTAVADHRGDDDAKGF